MVICTVDAWNTLVSIYKIYKCVFFPLFTMLYPKNRLLTSQNLTELCPVPWRTIFGLTFASLLTVKILIFHIHGINQCYMCILSWTPLHESLFSQQKIWLTKLNIFEGVLSRKNDVSTDWKFHNMTLIVLFQEFIYQTNRP